MKVLIVENNFFIAQSIVLTLKSFGYQPIEPVETYTDALNTIKEHQPDLAILDIELSSKRSGIDLANTISDNHPNLPFIFLTAKTEKEILNQAKFANPNSILIKPFHAEALYATIEVVLYQHSNKNAPKLTHNIQKQDHLFIKQKDGYVKVNFIDILFIKSDGVYMDVLTTNQTTYTDRSSVNNYLNKLNQDFIQIHRSYIVNIKHVKKIMDSSYVNINDKFLPIGRKYKNTLLKKLNIL